jgi:acyl-CoA thioesterase I
MKRARLWALALLGSALAGPAVAAEQIAFPEQCTPVSEEAEPSAEALPRVAGVLHPGATLDVLVVGTAQDPGHPTSMVATSGIVGYPWKMAEAVEAAVPGLKVNLTVRGRHGAAAGEVAELIRDEVGTGPYKLVLWQTGTVEAVGNVSPDDFTQALVEGVDAATSKGADIVLVGPKYSRFLEAHADVEPYERALEQVAGVRNVALLPRYDLMRRWADAGQIDLERADVAERRPTLQLLHTCLGDYLARMVLAGLKP